VALLKRASKLQESVRELDALRGMSHRAQALQSRADQMTGGHSRVRTAIDRYLTLSKWGVRIPANTGSARGLALFARELRMKVEADPSVVLSPDLEIGPKFINPLKLLSESLERETVNSWSHWIESLTPKIGSGLLEILGRIRGLRSQVDIVRSKLQVLRGYADSLPSDENDIIEVRGLAKEVEEAWKGLKADSLPSEVVEFLRDAGSNQGAALDKLSPIVRDWLERHALQTSFAIRTR
jgi:hypothetical protein